MLVVLPAFLLAGAFGVWAVITVAWRVAQRRNIDPMDLMLELGLAEWPSSTPVARLSLSDRIHQAFAQLSLTMQALPRIERPAPRARHPVVRVPTEPRREVLRTLRVEEIRWSDPGVIAPARPLRASLRDPL